MITAIHQLVAADCRRGGMPISDAAVAELDERLAAARATPGEAAGIAPCHRGNARADRVWLTRGLVGVRSHADAVAGREAGDHA